MVKLALMCKSKNFKHEHTDYHTNFKRYSTGQWVIGDKKQKSLLGEKVILVNSQKSPAYMGGTILGFEKLKNGKVEVIFSEENDLVGNTDSVSHRGWGCGRGVCYV